MKLDREKLFSPLINAFFFTYMAIGLYTLLPDFGVTLSTIQVLGFSTAWTVLVNLWNQYLTELVMDERKEKTVTKGMAWAFVTVSLAFIPATTTGVELTTELIRGTVTLGLWTFIMYLSLVKLYQRFGGDLK